ncbi:hypothetical protein PpBr36_05048 [Pyricularia pennisetigena]|uniref:hypothetical protein n=1 Tax=Pyricularia pennisetigena TaxID=1578925 RepID=UPI00114E0BCE|nr:hypothetical protein PpBr36_05048 [Pyricularia pennisetigena]TLS26227.1 hypothetical protein PpBr36_05048 [Pyricularia pennisetigena]
MAFTASALPIDLVRPVLQPAVSAPCRPVRIPATSTLRGEQIKAASDSPWQKRIGFFSLGGKGDI